MSLRLTDFCAFHAAVHGGASPFAWQQRLLEQVLTDKAWPKVLDLPTGAGKTTCIDVALFALALDVENDEAHRWCPRRIAMVVDRRIVVDQVAERGRKLLNTLLTSQDRTVVEVASRLRSLTRTGEEPLGVFTLRGGMPKDDGWARTPDQPLVIASTVDQVGSRMLMQGYGVSQSMKPVHAGLLANDTLLLLDEVHLSEPFRQMLDQLARIRTRFAGSGLRPRFSHAFLSATPGPAVADPFALLEDEKRPESPLGPRLHASKPTSLVEVVGRRELERQCVAQTKSLLARHRTTAVIVNRVDSASEIARNLAVSLGPEVTVTLLTGRMRPLDRDDILRELRPAIQTGRARSEDTTKRVIVGTQCLEAGADFDFDALVTESASLDSLRQRFGRVDRLGRYGMADGVVVHDRSAKQDPIYGMSISETAKWFKGQEKDRPRKLKDELKRLKDEAKTLRGQAKVDADTRITRMTRVDFGVLALEAPQGAELTPLLVAKPDSPTLLPAYLDLWAQTSPAPGQVPDVSLWLHGPSARPPDVQVVWRADLSERLLQQGAVDDAIATVAAVRPSTLEAISLPIGTVRAWLTNQPAADLGDTEGAHADELDRSDSESRRALKWRGDDSQIVDAAGIGPGDTIIVPSSYGGVRDGCFDASSTLSVDDRAEQASLFARAHPVLRVHPNLVEKFGLSPSLDEPDEVRATLASLATREDWPEWKRLWAERVSRGRTSFVVPGDHSWTVLEASRVPIADIRKLLQPEESIEDGIELTTDGDDSYCAGRAVSLAEHSADVESLARDYATRCGLDPWLAEHIALAAWVHDIGKADPRFQLMLRGGSEVEYFKNTATLAKSAMPRGAREQRRLARLRSGYPGGGHLHAVQSVAMLHGQLAALRECLRRVDDRREPDLELVLHLVASHHGECRPFAPAIIDDNPVDVVLHDHASRSFGVMDFPTTSSQHFLHRLDSPLAECFWDLNRKYGWHGLCWLEAILRLADHRASEEEQRRP
ncbi:MAG: type I-U CRISPR-associated helicase/endonuclease Cas3 [Planctomycetota bacterium]